MTSVRIEVPGIPSTKGSGRGIPFRRAGGKLGVRVINAAGDKARAWEYAVGLLARQAMRGRPLMEGPLVVSIDFLLPRPKSVKRETPCVRPDLDKLVRCCLDPLSGIVWGDDGQVVAITAWKRYVEPNESAGAYLTIATDTV